MQSLGDGRPEDRKRGDGQRQIAAASKDIRHLGKGRKALLLTAEEEDEERGEEGYLFTRLPWHAT